MKNENTTLAIDKEKMSIWLIDILPTAIGTGIVTMYLARILLIQFLDVWLERPYMYFIGIISAIGVLVEQKLKFIDHVVDKEREEADASTDEIIQSVENMGASVKGFFKKESEVADKKTKSSFNMKSFGETALLFGVLFAVIYGIAALICWSAPCETALGFAIISTIVLAIMAGKGVLDDKPTDQPTDNVEQDQPTDNQVTINDTSSEEK